MSMFTGVMYAAHWLAFVKLVIELKGRQHYHILYMEVKWIPSLHKSILSRQL
jgi:hypothetical protein